ncbi:hypothetical protein N9262_02315 [Akkermansiaceae bacterium]|nr:hypothetical protein [Akkermansiaceae bacterium]
MTLIETVEVGAGGASSIQFDSIPQDGVDLVIRMSARNEVGAGAYYMRFNNDTGNNYAWARINGTASSALHQTTSGTTVILFQADNINDTANTFSSSTIQLANYTSAAPQYGSIENNTERNGNPAYSQFTSFRYFQSSAITSITIFASSGEIEEYSLASIYKITAD